MEDIEKLLRTSLSLNILAGGISSIFSNNENQENIVKLLGLQMQLLDNIGGKIDLIQEQLDYIYDTLEKIGENLEDLPENVVIALYKKDLKSILVLIKEKNVGFRIDYKSDPERALKSYKAAFQEMLPILQVARTKLFYLKQQLTLPIVCSCFYFELICMKIANDPPTLFNVVINSYKNWINGCLEDQLNSDLKTARDKHRVNIEKITIINCFNFNFLFDSIEKTEIVTHWEKGEPVFGEVEVSVSHFAMNRYSCKLEQIDILKNDSAVAQLIKRDIIDEVEIPGKLVVDSLLETKAFAEETAYDRSSPIFIVDNWFNISDKDLSESVDKDSSNFINNPVKYRLVKDDTGNIQNSFGQKFRAEESTINDEMAKSGYDLLKYASLVNIAKSTLEDINRILADSHQNKTILFYQAEMDRTSNLFNPWADELIKELEEKATQINLSDSKNQILAIRDKFAYLKINSSNIYQDYRKLEKEVLENLSKDEFGDILNMVQNIGSELEKGAQNIAREAEKFSQDLKNNLEKGLQDIVNQLERDGGNFEELAETVVDFVGNQIDSYGKTLSDAEKRIREGKIVDAIWHFYTDPIKYQDDNLAKAVQDSSLLNSIASSVCTIYGGPGGAAAYAAWYTYKLTNDLNLALKTGIISGLTSYATQNINSVDGNFYTDDIVKRSLATSAAGAVAIAASGGDEKAIMEGFLKGAALSLASNTYKDLTAKEIQGRAPTQDPALKLKLDYTNDKYLILKDSTGKDLFKTIYNEDMGEFHIIPNDGAEIMTLQQLGRSVSVVGIASASDNGFQVFSETAIPMKLLAKVPYMNDMAYFHDIWCDKIIENGYDLNAFEVGITIIPAAVLTVGGSPTPLLIQINDLIANNN